MKFTTIITAIILAASSTSAFAMGGYEPTEIWVHPKLPAAKVFDFGGIATDNAFIEAKYTEETIKDWCENWRPGDEDCTNGRSFGDGSEIFKISANCKTGELTDPFDNHYKFSGVFPGDELFERTFEFTDLKTKKIVTQDNAAGGRVLASFWSTLCPLGAPYDILPLEQVIDTNKDYPALRGKLNISHGAIIGHNGSTMHMDTDLGVITYIEPKHKSIPYKTVLFRGQIQSNGSIRGMAYTFKKGCDPAPYYVEGYDQGSEIVTLEGKAPIRKGCEVVGYTEDSPNAKLEFVFFD
ncbi:hypothetical protein [Pseudorhizobium flavum]|uniref:hypothetical protein n=1 Tax=Pseudorhizobium flavum TaxID=1335061 RepID=UPI00376FD4F6